MAIADHRTYLLGITGLLCQTWPSNRTVNIVCHGHSVPAGYFATPVVDSLHAYPFLLHKKLKKRFPYAVINAIVTAVGGEESANGAARFPDVLAHRPDLVLIDYALNDRRIGLQSAWKAWDAMVGMAVARDVKILLLTPSPDGAYMTGVPTKQAESLAAHAAQIRSLAEKWEIGFADVLSAFHRQMERGGTPEDLLSWSNHPNARGHALIATELMRWFPSPSGNHNIG